MTITGAGHVESLRLIKTVSDTLAEVYEQFSKNRLAVAHVKGAQDALKSLKKVGSFLGYPTRRLMLSLGLEFWPCFRLWFPSTGNSGSSVDAHIRWWIVQRSNVP